MSVCNRGHALPPIVKMSNTDKHSLIAYTYRLWLLRTIAAQHLSQSISYKIVLKRGWWLGLIPYICFQTTGSGRTDRPGADFSRAFSVAAVPNKHLLCFFCLARSRCQLPHERTGVPRVQSTPTCSHCFGTTLPAKRTLLTFSVTACLRN